MIDKEPTMFAQFVEHLINILTYGWVIVLSLLGGVSSFARKVKSGKVRYSNIVEFIGELVISCFAGLVTFFLCKSAGLDEMLTAAFIAISSHMGTRSIFLFESYLSRRFGLEEQK